MAQPVVAGQEQQRGAVGMPIAQAQPMAVGQPVSSITATVCVAFEIWAFLNWDVAFGF